MTLDMEEAMKYLNEIKGTNQLGAEIYNGFIKLIIDFGSQSVHPDDLLAKIRELFKGHKTLVTRFNDFLPEERQIILSEDEIALSFINNVKIRFVDDHEAFESFIHILDKYASKEMSIIEVYKKVARLFRTHRDLLREFKNYLPDTSLGVEKPTSLPVHVEKKRKIEDNAAKQFRSCKGSFRSSLGEVGSSSNGNCNGLKSNHGQEFAFFEKVKKDINSNDYRRLMKYLELHNLEIITQSELQNMVNDLLENHPKLLKGFNNILKGSQKIVGSKEPSKDADIGGEDPSPSKNTEKSLTKCELITPSYKLLSTDFPVATKRTPLAKRVLNDHYVCVSPGSRDYSFSQKRMNTYEEKMLRLEDARFEMDIYMDYLSSTSDRAKVLMDENMFGADHVLQLERYFTARNLWCIEKLFGEWGFEVLDFLRDNPSRVLPIIHNRLLQKKNELVKYHTYFNNCANNPHNFTSFPSECGQKDLEELQRNGQNNSEENISSPIVDCVVLEKDSVSRQLGNKNG